MKGSQSNNYEMILHDENLDIPNREAPPYFATRQLLLPNREESMVVTDGANITRLPIFTHRIWDTLTSFRNPTDSCFLDLVSNYVLRKSKNRVVPRPPVRGFRRDRSARVELLTALQQPCLDP